MGHLSATVTTQIEPTSSIANRIVLKKKLNSSSDDIFVNDFDENNNDNNSLNNNCVNSNCNGYKIVDNNNNISGDEIDQQKYNAKDNNNNSDVVEDYNIQVKKLPRFNLGFDEPLKWSNIFAIFIIHGLFVYFLFHEHAPPVSILGTTLWGFMTGGMGGFGITAGAHRLWTHKAYKATVPLRIILMLGFTLAGQNSLYDWIRDHRVHHKFSETDADPHNARRGFFFAHCGWLMMNKHPEVLKHGKLLDMSDILNDPVVQFHQKYFIPLKMFLCFIMPTVTPMLLWGESFYWAFVSQCIFRYVLNLNFTWSVNSAAHLWGTRPYDKTINPAENLAVSIIAMGEGWHNYHHVFPWDYKAAELANYFNMTTFWINQYAKIGWAYDLKQPSAELIQKTIQRYGDGTHFKFGHHLSEIPPPDEGYYDSKNS